MYLKFLILKVQQIASCYPTLRAGSENPVRAEPTISRPRIAAAAQGRAMPRTKPTWTEPASAKPPPTSEPPQALERREICIQALALARRADAAGLWITAYLLDMAAMEADATIAKRLPGGARQA
jgi:hypothetical protein